MSTRDCTFAFAPRHDGKGLVHSLNTDLLPQRPPSLRRHPSQSAVGVPKPSIPSDAQRLSKARRPCLPDRRYLEIHIALARAARACSTTRFPAGPAPLRRGRGAVSLRRRGSAHCSAGSLLRSSDWKNTCPSRGAIDCYNCSFKEVRFIGSQYGDNLVAYRIWKNVERPNLNHTRTCRATHGNKNAEIQIVKNDVLIVACPRHQLKIRRRWIADLAPVDRSDPLAAKNLTHAGDRFISTRTFMTP